MLTNEEKNKIKENVKDVIQYGLGVKRDINPAYFLQAIDDTTRDVKDLQLQKKKIIHNQRTLEDKLDYIINILMSKL